MIEKIREYLESRPPRERYILIGGAAVTVVFMLYWMAAGFSSGPSGQSGLDRALSEREEFFKVLEQYKTLHGQVRQIDNRLRMTQENIDLFALLNSFAEQTGIKNQISKMDPSEGAGTEYYDEWYVDMNLDQVPLQPLTTFLEKIEQSSGFLRITRMTVKRRYDASEMLDVNLRVNAYRAKQG